MQGHLRDRADVLFVSIHGDPLTEYPFFLGHADETGRGAGLGFNCNLPLPAGTTADAWFAAFDQALARELPRSNRTRWWCRSVSTPSRAIRFRTSS